MHTNEGGTRVRRQFHLSPVFRRIKRMLATADSSPAAETGEIFVLDTMVPVAPPEGNELSIHDVVELLEHKYAVITGGKTKEGYPIISLPDNSIFANLSDSDYQKLMIYLTSVPSMHEADLGFALVVDRRNDKWSSVKNTLQKISSFFPGLIHVAYVVRPAGFFQKAISEVSNKFLKEEFKFKVVIFSCVEDLHQCIDRAELSSDMDGTLPYSHKQWIRQRLGLEEFSRQTHSVSGSLDKFTWRLRESISEAEVAESEMVRAMLNSETSDYLALKEQILSAARTGEQLLSDIRHRLEPSAMVNITAVERLLVQLEETERTFDEFWEEHSARLRQCLDVQRFYIDYKKILAALEQHLKMVSQMTEIGETVKRVEYLINEFNALENMCKEHMEQCEEIINFGRGMISGRHYWPLECVGVRCDELERTCATLRERLEQRSNILTKSLQLLITVDKANKWCTRGIDLLEARMDNCACGLDAAEVSLSKLVEFMEGSNEFNAVLVEYSTPETKALVSQVLQRIEDVKTMCNKKMITLKRLVEKPPRPVQTVTPEPAIPLQPMIRPANIVISPKPENKVPNEARDAAVEKEHEIKRGHILAELLETERIYVSELESIVKGYKHPMLAEETRHLNSELDGKSDIIFGNLEEIYTFHNDIFLTDLENCISTTELVALCFTHRKDALHKLYSCYCQNTPRSERHREAIGDHPFLRTCQTKLGHKLPLAAYLLKPVQRITKYRLLLEDLLSHSEGKKWCSELQEALDCMLAVLKCVNDSMHQTAITGFWGDLGDLGDLLMQGGFSVWTESKKDRFKKELRLIKPMQRHLFLYQKALLMCKKTSVHSRFNYQFKKLIKMSDVGLTETVKDTKTFEVWLTGRSEVHTIQAATVEQKIEWVDQIKSLLLYQLTQLKMKQHSKAGRSMSLDHYHGRSSPRAFSCDEGKSSKAGAPSDEETASSDFSNSDDEETFTTQVGQDSNIAIISSQGSRYRVLADYTPFGHNELPMKEGDIVTLLKVGCAGWWYVRLSGAGENTRKEGWAPAAYLEHFGRKTSRSAQSVTSDTSSH